MDWYEVEKKEQLQRLENMPKEELIEYVIKLEDENSNLQSDLTDTRLNN